MAKSLLSGTYALTLCILVLLLSPTKVGAWITLDGGENVTLHGNTNVGPPDTMEKYDLNEDSSTPNETFSGGKVKTEVI